jgi:hypothetical protein
MLGVANMCPHFMCFGHVPGGLELLEVETHACPRVIGPAVADCFWVWVAKREIETRFNSCGGGALRCGHPSQIFWQWASHVQSITYAHLVMIH